MCYTSDLNTCGGLAMVVWISRIVNRFGKTLSEKKEQVSFDLHSSYIPEKFSVLLNYYAKIT